jgi:plasmid stability protein
MILQIRDVDSDDVAVLRERAERLGMSLSAYIRGLLHQEAAQPTNAEVVSRIAAESPVDIAPDAIVGFIEAERP